MTMTECKKCGEIATKTTNLLNVYVDCSCGTYTEDIMKDNPNKSVIYDLSIEDFRVVNVDDYFTENTVKIHKPRRVL